MNQLSTSRRAQVVSALVEGNSIRSTERMTGVAKHTILKLVRDLGSACAEFHDRTARNLVCKRLECDEIWSFCHCKQKNIPSGLEGKNGIGSVWTWTGIDPETKFMVSWLVGDRNEDCALEFMADLKSRVIGRPQITSDGFKPYVDAIEKTFGADADFSMLVKMYGNDDPLSGKKRSICVGSVCQIVSGNPNINFISTSMVERANLTMRMGMRRFTRKTNGFSKKVENHQHAIAIHFMHYNFCRVHQTLRVTPAMEAGLADHVWGLQDLVGLVETKAANVVA